MRLWSIHPQYLDRLGLVALWRETLLAKNVLEGNTKGYKNHPQLNRFKKQKYPICAINAYLSYIYEESVRRKYHFDTSKFIPVFQLIEIPVTVGQVEFEFNHLLAKLKTRDLELYNKLNGIVNIEQHPVFKIISGEIEDWEKV